MWKTYFDNLDLSFLEYNTKCVEEWRPKIEGTIYAGNQGNVNDLYSIIDSSGGNFDVIVDDGSHHSLHQITRYS